MSIMLAQAWAGDEGKTPEHTLAGSIAYVSGIERDLETAIYVADADGTSVRRLPETEGAMFLCMDRSGQLITFAAGEGNERELFVIGANGTGKRRLTHNSASDHDPCFSVDGSRIVFVSERDGRSEIYVMNADGSQQKRLTFHASIKSSPSFSPDGARIAFTSVDSRYNDVLVIKLLIVNSDGTNLRRFGRTSGYSAPVWCPDSHALLCEGNLDLAILPLSGSKPKHLPIEGFSASWSPDGKHIVFSRLTDFVREDKISVGYYNVFTMDADGRNVRPLASNRRSDGTLFANVWPSWGGKSPSTPAPTPTP